jgi:hypothetical protein
MILATPRFSKAAALVSSGARILRDLKRMVRERRAVTIPVKKKKEPGPG